MSQSLDILTLTASEAQNLLAFGKTTSVELVKAYLTQIEKHNHNGLHLNALISVAPAERVLEIARKLDQEREQGQLRGPLHGLPFIVKDVFVTHPDLGMPTTAGGPCFASAKAKRTAPVLQHLMDSGLILLAKANLTEFCGMKEKGNTPGWSPAGGQTQSPYVYGGLEEGEKLVGQSTIAGSSSGTCSGVAAGFAPLGIGTECVGSVVTPANRGGLYSVKIRPGKVNDDGGFKYTDCLDCIGGVAKSVADLNPFVAALMEQSKPFDVVGGFDGLRIGFLDPKVWRLPDEICGFPGTTREQMETAFLDAKERIRKAGATVTNAQDMPWPDEVFKYEDKKSAPYEIAFYQVANKYLPAFFDEFSESEVRSIEDIIRYNEDHADVCLPPKLPKQGEFHDIAANWRTAADAEYFKTDYLSKGKAVMDKQFESCEIVVALGDSPLCIYSSAASLPIGTLPLTTVRYSDENERPFGLCAVARTEQELLRFMAAFEGIFPPRPLPKPLMSSTAS